MEKDDEVSGTGNSYTTEFRHYDPRLERWKSLDPLMTKFPWMPPYVAFDNNPVYYNDPRGYKAPKLGGRKTDNAKKNIENVKEAGETAYEIDKQRKELEKRINLK